MIFDIVVGIAIGPFRLGTPLPTVLRYLHQNYSIFPSVDFVYDASQPLLHDLIVTIAGMQLRFEPVSQRLKLVDVLQPSIVRLTYGAKSLKTTRHGGATFEHLYHLLSPTNGVFDPVNREFRLVYPGLVLFFPVPPEIQRLYPGGKVDLTAHERFIDGSHPVLSKLSVFCGTDVTHPVCPPVNGDIHHCHPAYGEVVKLVRSESRNPCDQGLFFTRRNVFLSFGATPQDALSLLGPPSGIFYKTDDKMRIHAEGPGGSTGGLFGTPVDYFFNYSELGVVCVAVRYVLPSQTRRVWSQDVLFDGAAHEAKKFVLHANLPGHFDFGSSFKCNFALELDSAVVARPRSDLCVVAGAAAHALQSGLGDVGDTDSSESDGSGLDAVFVVTPATHFADVQQALEGRLGEPVAFNRASNTNSTNPFGSTFFFGWEDVIFEVTATGHLAAVTWFCDIATH